MFEVRRSPSAVFAIAALVMLGVTLFLFAGFFTDAAVSFLLSRQLKTPSKCHGAHFKSLREINFTSLKIYSEDKRLLLSSFEGHFFLGKHTRGLRLHQAVFHEAALGMFLAGGMTQWLGTLKKPLAVQNMRLLMDRQKKTPAVHFTAKNKTGSVYLRGGFQSASGRFLRGHALVRIPDQWLEEIPEPLRPGGIKKGGDWVEFKIFAGENSFRLMGENGPLLEAGWR